ncbi:MAG: nucleotidyltransferase domain-containing protein [Gemmatimonadota bacterium]|nr:nucleotidyltransferase domain-containing protein [Gemmatimonadota bacterium]
MATITLRNIPRELHDRLKSRAERNRRSLNSEAVLLLEQAVEAMPEEAELRARFLERVEAERSSATSVPPEYESATPPLMVLREAAAGVSAPSRQAPALDRAEVRRRIARDGDRLRSLGVRRIGLFGSVVRGESRQDSDVDVLVEFDPARKSFDALVELAARLEALLGRDVDLVTTEGLSPHIGPRILEEAEFVGLDD